MSPKSSREFWETKFDSNVKRDKRDQKRLVEAGWRILVVWECEIESDKGDHRPNSRLSRPSPHGSSWLGKCLVEHLGA